MKQIIILTMILFSFFFSEEKEYDSHVKYHAEYDLEYRRMKSSESTNFRQISLVITDSISINMDSKKMESEILKATGGDWEIPGRNGGPRFIVIKNKVKGKVQILEPYVSPPYLALEEDLMDENRWQITDETKTQLGYSTIKAITENGGRIWEAWFTPEIPISDGPYKFSGLPGLIVALSSTDGDFDFKLNSFGKMDDNFHVLDNLDYTVMPGAKFIEFLRSSSSMMLNALTNTGSNITMKNENLNIRNVSRKEDADRVLIEIK